MAWHWLLLLLLTLVVISGFFSSSETGLMALNRYRLQHRARKGHAKARRLVNFVTKPDQILSLILIGNTFANIAASAVATVLAGRYLGHYGVFVASIVLTFVVLLFSEIMPKTWAATYPERVAYAVVPCFHVLMRVLYPLVWLLNRLSRTLLRFVGIEIGQRFADPLSHEELRGLISGGSQPISLDHRNMLVGVMDLESVHVEDVMILKKDLVGLDLDAPWEAVLQTLRSHDGHRLLVYRGSIDKALGILPTRQLIQLLLKKSLNKNAIERSLVQVRYIPEGVSLNQQLQHFLEHGYDVGLVVNEYGYVIGMLTMDEIVEEIVGEFATEDDAPERLIDRLADGHVLVQGEMHLRDLNRAMSWELPLNGPNTLGGLIVEHLQAIPQGPVGLGIGPYRMEVVKMRGNRILQVDMSVQPSEVHHAHDARF